MVVVPTSKDVTLEYGTTPAEWLGRAGTVAGVIGVGALVWWWRPGRRPDEDEPGDETGGNQRESQTEGIGSPAVR
jgi:hypothetical protein